MYFSASKIPQFLHKNKKKCKKICTCHKKAVPLHPLLKKVLLNGVMVALQILVLSVWVRVLVEQQKRRGFGLFFCFNGTLTQVLISFFELKRLISKLIFRVLFIFFSKVIFFIIFNQCLFTQFLFALLDIHRVRFLHPAHLPSRPLEQLIGFLEPGERFLLAAKRLGRIEKARAVIAENHRIARCPTDSLFGEAHGLDRMHRLVQPQFKHIHSRHPHLVVPDGQNLPFFFHMLLEPLHVSLRRFFVRRNDVTAIAVFVR